MHNRRVDSLGEAHDGVSPAAPTIAVNSSSEASVNSLSEASDLSTNNVTHVTHSPAITPALTVVGDEKTLLRRRRGRDMYYSVIVGKCCGVYFSW